MNASTIDIGNGIDLYYEEAGSGPVILFVHGMWGYMPILP